MEICKYLAQPNLFSPSSNLAPTSGLQTSSSRPLQLESSCLNLEPKPAPDQPTNLETQTSQHSPELKGRQINKLVS